MANTGVFLFVLSALICTFRIELYLTVPHVKHVMNEVIVKAQLRFGDGACGSVKLGHHHREAKALFLVRLSSKKENYVNVIFFDHELRLEVLRIT